MTDNSKPGRNKSKPKPKPKRGAETSKQRVSRRDMLLASGAAAALGALPKGAGAADEARAQSPAPASGPYPAARKTPLGRPYNVILFISDEETYRLRPAEGYATPAREELVRRGTTFHNHYIGAAMCTPSRGVMFSGQPPQHRAGGRIDIELLHTRQI